MATRRILFFKLDPTVQPSDDDKATFRQDMAAIREGDDGPFLLPGGVTPCVVEVGDVNTDEDAADGRQRVSAASSVALVALGVVIGWLVRLFTS